MDISKFTQCFDKHSFNELNNIDIHTLNNALNFYKNKFPNTYGNGYFFDVGCNAGSFIKVLEYSNIKNNVHCFEPHPILSEKTKHIYPHINMNGYCIGNIDGDIDIFIPQFSVGLSSVINRPVFNSLNQEINKINVKCIKLDTYCKENNIDTIDFIKIDVEGAEKLVFEGAINLLENKKIKCGIFEVGQTLYDAGTSGQEICDMLISYGYSINKNISGSDYVFYLE